jgi:predicted lipoprotein with Yx(FWY)xxD motif
MLKLRNLILLLVVLLVAVPVFAQDDGPTVGWSSSEDLGSYLVGPNGMTLYIFNRDPLNSSVCSGPCLENWPALTVESADAITAADGITGALGTITREDDGTLQVTYNGQPLYYWAHDEAVGDTTGQAVGRVWWIASPSTVSAVPNEELGSVLVGPSGMTVYMFANDTAGSGESACYEQCATNWPPLTVESADGLVLGQGLPGELGTIERTDGTLQVTYNGWPLYYWKDDAAVGDTLGEGVGDVWFTIPQETVAVSSSDDLGDFLTAPNGLTLYTFANDEAGVSNCADTCAENWPAYTVGANARLTGSADAMGEIATIERADGSLQVTYNGMPLYYWKDDKAAGDTLGQGLGDVWFVAAP